MREEGASAAVSKRCGFATYIKIFEFGCSNASLALIETALGIIGKRHPGGLLGEVVGAKCTILLGAFPPLAKRARRANGCSCRVAVGTCRTRRAYTCFGIGELVYHTRYTPGASAVHFFACSTFRTRATCNAKERRAIRFTWNAGAFAGDISGTVLSSGTLLACIRLSGLKGHLSFDGIMIRSAICASWFTWARISILTAWTNLAIVADAVGVLVVSAERALAVGIAVGELSCWAILALLQDAVNLQRLLVRWAEVASDLVVIRVLTFFAGLAP